MHVLEPNQTPLPAVEIEIHEHLRTAIVTLRGEHDITTRWLIREALALATEHARVLVDLSACTFADSSLINALVDANAAIKQRDGLLEVVVPPEAGAARRIAELARLDEIIPVHAVRTGVS